MEKEGKIREIELELKKYLDSELIFDTENKTWYHDKYGFAIMGSDGELFKLGKSKVDILKILEGFSYKEIRGILRSVEDKVGQHSRL